MGGRNKKEMSLKCYKKNNIKEFFPSVSLKDVQSHLKEEKNNLKNTVM